MRHFPLYGVCLYSMEMIHRPPHLARSNYPGCNQPHSKYMIAAPRCYCLLSHYPFFDLHFNMLRMLVDSERALTCRELSSELSTMPFSPDSSLKHSPSAPNLMDPSHYMSSLVALKSVCHACLDLIHNGCLQVPAMTLRHRRSSSTVDKLMSYLGLGFSRQRSGKSDEAFDWADTSKLESSSIAEEERGSVATTTSNHWDHEVLSPGTNDNNHQQHNGRCQVCGKLLRPASGYSGVPEGTGEEMEEETENSTDETQANARVVREETGAAAAAAAEEEGAAAAAREGELEGLQSTAQVLDVEGERQIAGEEGVDESLQQQQQQQQEQEQQEIHEHGAPLEIESDRGDNRDLLRTSDVQQVAQEGQIQGSGLIQQQIGSGSGELHDGDDKATASASAAAVDSHSKDPVATRTGCVAVAVPDGAGATTAHLNGYSFTDHVSCSPSPNQFDGTTVWPESSSPALGASSPSSIASVDMQPTSRSLSFAAMAAPVISPADPPTESASALVKHLPDGPALRLPLPSASCAMDTPPSSSIVDSPVPDPLPSPSIKSRRARSASVLSNGPSAPPATCAWSPPPSLEAAFAAAPGGGPILEGEHSDGSDGASSRASSNISAEGGWHMWKNVFRSLRSVQPGAPDSFSNQATKSAQRDKESDNPYVRKLILYVQESQTNKLRSELRAATAHPSETTTCSSSAWEQDEDSLLLPQRSASLGTKPCRPFTITAPSHKSSKTHTPRPPVSRTSKGTFSSSLCTPSTSHPQPSLTHSSLPNSPTQHHHNPSTYQVNSTTSSAPPLPTSLPVFTHSSLPSQPHHNDNTLPITASQPHNNDNTLPITATISASPPSSPPSLTTQQRQPSLRHIQSTSSSLRQTTNTVPSAAADTPLSYLSSCLHSNLTSPSHTPRSCPSQSRTLNGCVAPSSYQQHQLFCAQPQLFSIPQQPTSSQQPSPDAQTSPSSTSPRPSGTSLQAQIIQPQSANSQQQQHQQSSCIHPGGLSLSHASESHPAESISSPRICVNVPSAFPASRPDSPTAPSTPPAQLHPINRNSPQHGSQAPNDPSLNPMAALSDPDAAPHDPTDTDDNLYSLASLALQLSSTCSLPASISQNASPHAQGELAPDPNQQIDLSPLNSRAHSHLGLATSHAVAAAGASPSHEENDEAVTPRLGIREGMTNFNAVASTSTPVATPNRQHIQQTEHSEQAFQQQSSQQQDSQQPHSQQQHSQQQCIILQHSQQQHNQQEHSVQEHSQQQHNQQQRNQQEHGQQQSAQESQQGLDIDQVRPQVMSPSSSPLTPATPLLPPAPSPSSIHLYSNNSLATVRRYASEHMQQTPDTPSSAVSSPASVAENTTDQEQPHHEQQQQQPQRQPEREKGAVASSGGVAARGATLDLSPLRKSLFWGWSQFPGVSPNKPPLVSPGSRSCLSDTEEEPTIPSRLPPRGFHRRSGSDGDQMNRFNSWLNSFSATSPSSTAPQPSPIDLPLTARPAISTNSSSAQKQQHQQQQQEDGSRTGTEKDETRVAPSKPAGGQMHRQTLSEPVLPARRPHDLVTDNRFLDASAHLRMLEQLSGRRVIYPGEMLVVEPTPGLACWGLGSVIFQRPELPVKFTVVGLDHDVLRYADEELAHHLRGVTVGALCRYLSIPNIITILSAVLLEQKVVFACPSVSVLAAVTLSLVPLLQPFMWQNLFMPVLPANLAVLLQSPAPFVLGVVCSDVQHLLHPPYALDGESTEALLAEMHSNWVLVDILQDSVAVGEAVPKAKLPSSAGLAAAVKRLHTALHHASSWERSSTEGLAASLSASTTAIPTTTPAAGLNASVSNSTSQLASSPTQQGVHNTWWEMDAVQQAMAVELCQIVNQHWVAHFSELRKYSIARVDDAGARVPVLMDDVFVDSFSWWDRAFMKEFVTTRMFQVHSDRLLQAQEEML